MNKIQLSGVFKDEVRVADVGNTQVAETDLSFEVPGKDGPRKAWIQVQMWGDRAPVLAKFNDYGVGAEVTVTGSLNRQAWKNRDDEWESRHSITVDTITETQEALDTGDESELPFS